MRGCSLPRSSAWLLRVRSASACTRAGMRLRSRGRRRGSWFPDEGPRSAARRRSTRWKASRRPAARASTSCCCACPSGEHANDRRYPIAIAGPGYDGLLVSDRTRVPGLVSIYDIKPTVEALEEGREPPDHVPRRAERAGEAGCVGRAARRPRRLANAGGLCARGAHACVCAPGPSSPLGSSGPGPRS